MMDDEIRYRRKFTCGFEECGKECTGSNGVLSHARRVHFKGNDKGYEEYKKKLHAEIAAIEDPKPAGSVDEDQGGVDGDQEDAQDPPAENGDKPRASVDGKPVKVDVIEPDSEKDLQKDKPPGSGEEDKPEEKTDEEEEEKKTNWIMIAIVAAIIVAVIIAIVILSKRKKDAKKKEEQPSPSEKEYSASSDEMID